MKKLLTRSILFELPILSPKAGSNGKRYGTHPFYSCDDSDQYVLFQVCVTLEEWEEFPQQFEGSTNTKERALYKALIHIAEGVIEGIQVSTLPFKIISLRLSSSQSQAVIREAQKEAAVNTRKRSSRLLVIEQQQEAEAALSKVADEKQVVVGNLIGEGHVNYILMYNMLTGIRIGVSIFFSGSL